MSRFRKSRFVALGALFLVAGLLISGSAPVAKSAEVSTFSGGDFGDGLDLIGQFVYAINVGGPGGITVGNANFTDGSIAGMAGGSSPGATITVANQIPAWHAPEYGDSAADDSLEQVMQSIRWNTPPGVDIDLENLLVGTEYKLQLMFAESCCDRGFDLFIEDDLVLDDFNVQIEQGGINNTETGVLITHTFTATDSVLNLTLGGSNPDAPDNNPILNGLTLELNLPDAALGDVNLDDSVNLDDYVIIRDNMGVGTSFGDGNIDFIGVVSLNDFGIWKSNRDVVAAASANAAVPEPSSLVLMGIGVLLLVGRRRRVWQRQLGHS